MNASTDSHKSRHKSTPALEKSFVTKQTKNVTMDAGCDHGRLVTFPWRLVTFPGQRCDRRSHGINLIVSGHQKGTKKMYPRKRSCKKQPMKNGGFQKWDPPLTFAAHLTCEILFCEKMGIRTTPPGNCGFPGDIFRAFLRRFLHCQLPQVVLVKVKTAGY